MGDVFLQLDVIRHRYISTYCLHDLHDACRLTCKTCEARCLCECHKTTEAR